LLKSLSIKNYALIDELHVNFNSGLTIITGETGAGKSILLGGLSLILGKRADQSHILDTSKKCIIEAVFDISRYNLKSVFKAHDLDYDRETIIRREIHPSGKSRAFVNDTPVNLNVLTILGTYLIDIHSQHETSELTSAKFQFRIIDALAKNALHLEQYFEKLQLFRQLNEQLESLKANKTEAIKELDYNSFLLQELNEAKLMPGELENLESEYDTLSNIESIREELMKVDELLNDEQLGVLNNLSTLKNGLHRLSGYSNRYSTLFERVNSILIELDDLNGDFENAQEELEIDPARLDIVNAKLQVIHNLLLKHSVGTVDDLIAIRSDLSTKVEVSENIDDEILKTQNDLDHIETELNALALKIHDQREAAIPQLISRLEDKLVDLGMNNARFDISLGYGERFFTNGKDKLSLLFSANKGGDFKELRKSASGGELSRIMLAIKSILSSYIRLPSIMFDEIDSGISGEISNKVAGIMMEMSKEMQVFTITHLPQIASKGDTHFKVFKEDVDNRSATRLTRLNEDDRIVEIAQMLGGMKMSGSAIEHAKQLLN
jgi:DNA repair protein RecN (Recombination protein N)